MFLFVVRIYKSVTAQLLVETEAPLIISHVGDSVQTVNKQVGRRYHEPVFESNSTFFAFSFCQEL